MITFIRDNLQPSSGITFIRDAQSQNKLVFVLFKGILSTSCVIFSYPKLLSISVLTFIKWRLTPSYVAKDTIFWQKRPKTIVIRIIVWLTKFKSIHMAFYGNTSWACALFRNNKQHVVIGQKRNCQRVEESGLWLGPLPLDGANSRKCLIIVDR